MAAKKKKKKKNTLQDGMRQGMVISSCVFMSAVIIFSLAFYVYVSGSIGKTVYPESPLTKIMGESYSYVGDANLPFLLEAPTIPCMLSVGGTNIYTDSSTAIYKFDATRYIAISEITDTTSNYLNGSLIYNMFSDSNIGNVTYVREGDDMGYFNGYPAGYEYGHIAITNSNGRTLATVYALNLIVDMGYSSDIIITVITTSEDSMYSSGILLKSIGYTIMDTSDPNDTVYIDPQKKIDEGIFNESSIEKTTEYIEMIQTDEVDTKEMGLTYLFNFNETYEDCVFLFNYTLSDIAVGDDFTLISPDNTEYEPIEQTENTVVFKIHYPVKGQWILTHYTEIDDFSVEYMTPLGYEQRKAPYNAQPQEQPVVPTQPVVEQPVVPEQPPVE